MLTVRNEAKIIERCLEAAGPDVDAVLLADTGSDDDTIAIAEQCCAKLGKPLRMVRHEWCDFGHNRTLTFQALNGTLRQPGPSHRTRTWSGAPSCPSSPG